MAAGRRTVWRRTVLAAEHQPGNARFSVIPHWTISSGGDRRGWLRSWHNGAPATVASGAMVVAEHWYAGCHQYRWAVIILCPSAYRIIYGIALAATADRGVCCPDVPGVIDE